MNMLFFTLLYHPDRIAEVTARSRDGLQNQINSFQWALIQGLYAALTEDDRLSIVNALPVGAFPLHYHALRIPARQMDEHFAELGCLNLPGVKQWQRKRAAEQALQRWVQADSRNRTVLVYTLYLPYLQAVARVKRQYPDLRMAAIVTDLPNELGIASGRTGLLKRIEYVRGRKTLALCNFVDGFVLLAPAMAEPLKVGSRPSLVMEAVISETIPAQQPVALPDDDRPAVLYTGTLNRELGIAELIKAFLEMGDVQLWLCGKGDMEAEILAAAQQADNIRYFGFVPQSMAQALQSRAAALINPRTSQGVFTRYSFPSKTLEYMRAGKPVLCCKLEGIPDEYDAYLRYMEPQNAQGIRNAVYGLLALPAQQRAAMGEKARDFALSQKNSVRQGARLFSFLHALSVESPTKRVPS